MKAWAIRNSDGDFYTADQGDNFCGKLADAKLFSDPDNAADLCDFYADDMIVEVEINEVKKGG